jgi:DNA-binding protein H-NS
MSSYKELLAERERLDRMIEEAKARECATVINEIRQKMADYGITLAELGSRRGAKAGGRRAVEPKYRDPATGATWSGRGKPPAWIAGQEREKFLISGHE